jgi:hypothetical protein
VPERPWEFESPLSHRCDQIRSRLQPGGRGLEARRVDVPETRGSSSADGVHIAGVAVSIGARVASLATGSEMSVSQTVKDLVAGSGLVFEDAGEHELKGVPRSLAPLPGGIGSLVATPVEASELRFLTCQSAHEEASPPTASSRSRS